MKRYLDKIDPENLKILFSQAPIALAMLSGEDLIIDAANEQILRIWQRDATIIGKKLLDAIPELKGQKFPELLNNVYRTGETYKGFGEMAVLKNVAAYFDFTYSPIYEGGVITGVSVVASDVTNRVTSEQRAEDSELLYKDLILNADVSTAIYLGEDLVISLANEKMLKTWGKESSVIGKKLEDALPELKGQQFLNILKQVYRTGETYAAKDDKVDLVVDGRLQSFYYNFSYKPIRNAAGEIYGILNMAVEVTDHVIAKKKAEESEALLNNFIKNAPMSVSIMKGPEHIITVTNQKTAELWNGQDGRIGKKLIEAYPHLAGTATEKYLHLAYDTGEEIKVKDTKVYTDDDTVRYVNFILKPIKDAEGKTEYIISVGYDVSDEVVIRQKLKASEQQFRDLANSIPQLVWTADKNGHVNFYNDKWYEYTGFSRDVFGDQSWKDIVRPEQLEKTYKKWYESVKTGNDYHIEYELVDRKNPGKYRWFLGQAVPIKNEKGEIVEWLGTCTDIHEMKILQTQKDNFLGIASHELKTPLTSLKLYAQVLGRSLIKAGDEKNAGLALKMDEQADKLSSLIGDLLDVTKIQNGVLQFEETEFDFNELVKEVVEEIQLSSSHKIEQKPGDVGSVFGDRNRIAQVISNLVNNAIKYSPDADKIIVRSSVVNGNAKLSVQDFGIGIEEDKYDKVFDQYYRVSGSEQHTFPGLGLGLYISSEIIKRTGGRIWVNSKPNRGSTFSFEIPKYKSETE